MSSSLVRTHTLPPAWRYAVVGALASLPLAVVVNWFPASEANLAGGIMIFGAFIAGLVAATRSTEPDAAGFRTGLLAGAVGTLAPIAAAAGAAIENGVLAWPTTAEMVFFVGASAVILCLAPVFGLMCGRVGGWTAKRVATRWTADAS